MCARTFFFIFGPPDVHIPRGASAFRDTFHPHTHTHTRAMLFSFSLPLAVSFFHLSFFLFGYIFVMECYFPPTRPFFIWIFFFRGKLFPTQKERAQATLAARVSIYHTRVKPPPYVLEIV